MPSTRPGPTSAAALALALLSLLASATTAAWAAGLAPGSVGTKQLRADAVTGAKIRPGSVTADDLAADAVAVPSSGAASITRTPAFDLPVADTEMFSLTRFADTTTGALRADGESRLTITAVVGLYFNGSDQAGCHLEVLDATGWHRAGPTSRLYGQRFDPATLSVIGTYDVSGGFVDVRLMCRSIGSAAAIQSGALTVVSTPR